MNKRTFKTLAIYFSLFGLLVGLSMVFFSVAYAAGTDQQIPTIGGGGAGVEDVEQIIKDWMWKIRLFGVLFIAVAIIIAFIIIGMSLGNSAKRALGIAALVSAAVGIIGAAKAPALADYLISNAQHSTTQQSSSAVFPEKPELHIFLKHNPYV